MLSRVFREILAETVTRSLAATQFTEYISTLINKFDQRGIGGSKILFSGDEGDKRFCKWRPEEVEMLILCSAPLTDGLSNIIG